MTDPPRHPTDSTASVLQSRDGRACQRAGTRDARRRCRLLESTGDRRQRLIKQLPRTERALYWIERAKQAPPLYQQHEDEFRNALAEVIELFNRLKDGERRRQLLDLIERLEAAIRRAEPRSAINCRNPGRQKARKTEEVLLLLFVDHHYH